MNEQITALQTELANLTEVLKATRGEVAYLHQVLAYTYANMGLPMPSQSTALAAIRNTSTTSRDFV